MVASKRLDAGAAVAALLLCAALLLVGRASFGIWDPWEVARIELARGDSALELPPLGSALLKASLAAFGVSEGVGRLPGALGGLAAVLLVFALGARRGGLRFGTYAALVLGTSPLLLLHARTMVGESVAMAAQTGLGLCLFAAVFHAPQTTVEPTAQEQRRATLRTALWLGLAGVFATLATASAGLLQGALPPLAAVTVLAVVDGRVFRKPRGAQDLAAMVVSAVSLVASVGVALAVYRDAAGYDAVTGGSAGAGEPGTYQAVIEAVLHGFGPWSALLLVGLAQALEPHEEVEGPGSELTLTGARQRLSIFGALWAAGGYVTATVHAARLGDGVFLSVAALALVVAGLLVAVEESQRGFRMPAVLAVLFVGLLLRDFELYPERPLASLGLDGLTLPAGLETKLPWAIVLGIFAAGAVVSLGVSPQPAPLDLAAPYRFIGQQWRRDWADKAWLLAAGALLLVSLVFGGLCLVTPDTFGPIGAKIGKALFVLAVGLPLGLVLAQSLLFACQRLGRFRLVPIFVGGIAAAVYVGHFFLPAVGEQYSGRGVYSEWNELRGPSDSLLVYGIPTGSGSFYAEGPLREAKNPRDVAAELASGSSKWAAFPTDQLATIDATFRQQTRRHLFVLPTGNRGTTLAAGSAVAGRTNDNPLLGVVLNAPPAAIGYRTAINFGGNVELLGYDLSLPAGAQAQAGQQLSVTWYWHVLRAVPADYSVFVHIDGVGARIQGDHPPAGDLYPTSSWRTGDVIADKQEIALPPNAASGEYTIYLGLWRGETRMPVTSGEQDGADRAVAGKLRIR